MESISTDFAGVRVHEVPPNGQGITALLALNLLKEMGIGTDPKLADLPVFESSRDTSGTSKDKGEEAESAYLHRLIEVLRLAFADTRWYCADPDKVEVPVEELLSQGYAAERARLFDPSRQANFSNPYPARVVSAQGYVSTSSVVLAGLEWSRDCGGQVISWC